MNQFPRLTFVIVALVLSTITAIFFGSIVYGIVAAVFFYMLSVAYRVIFVPDIVDESSVFVEDSDDESVSIVSDFDQNADVIQEKPETQVVVVDSESLKQMIDGEIKRDETR